MICVCVVVCVGSLLCSWDVGRCSVVDRVDRVVSSLVGGRGLSPLCSFACTAGELRILSCVRPDYVIRVSSILSSHSPSTPIGGPGVLRVYLHILGVGIVFEDF